MQKPKLKSWIASYNQHLRPQGQALSPLAASVHASKQITARRAA